MSNFSMAPFESSTLTDAINKTKYAGNGVISRLGLFEESGIATTSAAIDFEDNALVLLPTAPRGGVSTPHLDSTRSLVTIDAVHIPTRTTLLADQIQDKREFGGTGLDQVQTVLNRRLLAMRANMDLTTEYHAYGAIKGQVLDVDGSILADMYAAFGIVQQTLAMDLTSTTKLLLNTVITAERMSEDQLGGATPTSFVALAAPDFMDALRANPSYVNDLKYQEPNNLFKDFRNAISVGNVTFVECRSTPGLPRRIPAGEAYLVPIGIQGLLLRKFAPAPYLDAVNSPGLPYYAKSEALPFDKGVMIEANSNPISFCTRPGSIIKLTAS
jgi:Phage major capsid protein E